MQKRSHFEITEIHKKYLITYTTSEVTAMNQLKRYTIIGVIFVLITGTLAHFIYEWTGNNFITGLFTPVNESTWEHMKLLFFPMLLYSFFMIPKFKKRYRCIASSMYCGILLGTSLIPVIFYTYSGILGFNFFILDLFTFVFSVITAFYTAFKLTLTCKKQKYIVLLCVLILSITVCFLVFTYLPPNIGLFAIPPSGNSSYGGFPDTKPGLSVKNLLI